MFISVGDLLTTNARNDKAAVSLWASFDTCHVVNGATNRTLLVSAIV